VVALAERGPQLMVSDELNLSQRRWRWRIFVITWLAYAGFYFCRKNLSVTMPLMAGELKLSKLQLANVVFGYSLLYSGGQFVCGLLADRFGSRIVVAFGLLIAVISNVLMGFGTSLAMLVTLACLNGAGQSGGWPGLVKTMAAWFRHKERGVVMSWWTTNYVIGGFAGTLFATFVVTSEWLLPGLGWRRGFWMPAIILFVILIAFFLLVKDRPSDAGLPAIVEGDGQSHVGEKHETFAETMAIYFKMLGDPAVWTVALGALFSKVTRYSFMFWLPLYLTESLKYSTREAGNTSSLFELAGFGGALLAGYVSDRFMQSRRLPVAAMMMWGLALACWAHPSLAALGHGGVALSICLIGIMNYGPDTLMQGAATQDVGAKWGVGKASGFIDGVSSIGQLISSYLVAIIAHHYGWNNLFYVFVALALVGGAVMATRWTHASKAHTMAGKPPAAESVIK
jgi:sugar phosphate permease